MTARPMGPVRSSIGWRGSFPHVRAMHRAGKLGHRQRTSGRHPLRLRARLRDAGDDGLRFHSSAGGRAAACSKSRKPAVAPVAIGSRYMERNSLPGWNLIAPFSDPSWSFSHRQPAPLAAGRDRRVACLSIRRNSAGAVRSRAFLRLLVLFRKPVRPASQRLCHRRNADRAARPHLRQLEDVSARNLAKRVAPAQALLGCHSSAGEFPARVTAAANS